MGLRLVCFAAVFLLLQCTSPVHLQTVRVEFSEDDYHEDIELSIINAVVTMEGVSLSNDSPAPVTFRVTAFTSEQFQSKKDTCQNAVIEPENLDQGEDNDLTTISVTCSGVPGNSNELVKIPCLFNVTQDNILEVEEYMLLALTVEDNGGYDIVMQRNCSVASISEGHPTEEELRQKGFLLYVTNSGPEIKVGEGDIVEFNVEKRFPSEVDVKVLIEVQNDPPPDRDSNLYGSSQSNDYILRELAVIPVIPPGPDMYIVNVSLEIINDQLVESTEYLTITFRCEVIGVGSLYVDNNVFGVIIQDNDAMVVNITPSGSLNVTEGDQVMVCAQLISPSVESVTKITAFQFEDTEESAKRNVDYFFPENSLINIADGDACIDIIIFNKPAAEGNKRFTVELVDTLIHLFSDADDLARHTSLVRIQSSTLSIVILDKQGPPNQPMVTIPDITIPSPGDPLTISWDTEDTPTNPLDCHSGNVTVTSDDDVSRDVVQFNYCNTNSPKTQDISVPDFDPGSTYTIVVCSMNPIGQNCSDSFVVYTPPALPTIVVPGQVLPPTTLGGIVGGVLVGVICLIAVIIILLVLILLKARWWRNYNPEKREKKYRAGYKGQPGSCPGPDFEDGVNMSVVNVNY